ncbi:MAG: GNAT family N-acetyltransferase [Alphaproteobacteria bacterium]
MTDPAEDAADGMQIGRITETAFREFARRHGSSPEIGPIGTYLDNDHGDQAYGAPHLFALSGCGEICAIVCCTVAAHRSGDGHACKLDSIIVHQSIRRGGLGAALVAKAFQEMMDDARFNISSFFSYAVHPATVRMLRRFGFSEPPPAGAPLSALAISDENRAHLVTELKVRLQDTEKKLKLQCTFCRKGDRRARRWCTHSP